ncbi:MAG: hypothetical protein ACLQAT_24755 [Candidatus Binataceae bacterium]
MPPLEVRAARKKLKRRSANPTRETWEAKRYDTWYAISVAKLDELIGAESGRALKLDEKAGKISAVLALALTIGGSFGISLIEKVSTLQLRVPMRFALLISVMYMIAGGSLAFFSGSAAKPHGGYGPDWEALLSGNRNQDKQPRVEALVDFENANLIRNNDISGALSCIRNGMLVFFLVLLLAVADPLVPVFIKVWAWSIGLLRGSQGFCGF